MFAVYRTVLGDYTCAMLYRLYRRAFKLANVQFGAYIIAYIVVYFQ